jgi:hypothetical protein
MAKLSDVELSSKGEPTTQPQPIIDTPVNLRNNTQIAEQQFVIFKLVKKQKRFWLDGICDNVLNPKTKRRERTWLLNGADSIWQSDLLELLKDKEYRNRNRRSILFEEGIAMVRITDERGLEFLRVHTSNVGHNRSGSGKKDFYEYDAASEQTARLERQMLKINMVIKAKEMPADKMKKLASFFGIMFVDDLGMPKNDDGIRAELMLKADSNPDLFSKYIDSQEVEVSYMVKRAIIDAKIDLTGQHGNALWAGGKGFICKIPAGRKPYEYLTELAMTNSEDGKRFKEELQTFGT